MELEEEIVKLLKSPRVLEAGGMNMQEIQDALGYPKEQVRNTVYVLYDKGVLVGVHDRKAGRWYRKYYSPPRSDRTLFERLEEVFTEMGIPKFVDVRVSRAGRTFLIGVYGQTPFTIVDYSSEPTLVFRDRRAGGTHDEVVYSKKRNRYVCKRGDQTKVYDDHGKPRAH